MAYSKKYSKIEALIEAQKSIKRNGNLCAACKSSACPGLLQAALDMALENHETQRPRTRRVPPDVKWLEHLFSLEDPR